MLKVAVTRYGTPILLAWIVDKFNRRVPFFQAFETDEENYDAAVVFAFLAVRGLRDEDPPELLMNFEEGENHYRTIVDGRNDPKRFDRDLELITAFDRARYAETLTFAAKTPAPTGNS